MVFFSSGSQCWYFSHETSSLFHHSVLVDFTRYSFFLSLSFFLSILHSPPPPSRGLRAGGLRLKATVRKVYGKDKDDSVKKNIHIKDFFSNPTADVKFARKNHVN